MKNFIYGILIIVVFLASTNVESDVLTKTQITQKLASQPLTFTKNLGQWDKKVEFRADAGRATMWFTTDGVFYHFTRAIKTEKLNEQFVEDHKKPWQTFPSELDSVETMTIKANFIGANQNQKLVGKNSIVYTCNYFIGNDQSKWAVNVPNYEEIVYQEIYDGIDLKYYGNGKQMEYDFIVSPGADFSQIRIQYEGADSVFINDLGELVVTTIWGEVVEQRPLIFQTINNILTPIDGKYILQSNNSFGFELSSGYNPALPLIIDPILTYSTYLGSDDNDRAYSIAIDNSGNAYVTGTTESTNFPTLNPYQVNTGAGGDVFVTKLNNTGDALLYSTYLGGTSGTDAANGIDVDSSGNIYVAGSSTSSDFPVMNAFQSIHGGGFNDIIAFKLNSTGDTLLYSTFVGGSLNEFGNSLVIDDNGNAFITGRTNSTNYPTKNAYQSTFGGNYDAYILKLNSSGDTLLYSTYLGGTDWDQGNAVTLDNNGNAYLTGITASTNFSVQNAYQSTIGGGNDVFVTILDSAGTTILYSTYLGGTNDDEGSAITLDDSNNIYISGKTSSSNFPTINAYQVSYSGGGDAFVSKFNNKGDTLIYSTYLGGTLDDYSNGIAVDNLGLAYITGSTRSTDFPIVNADQSSNGGNYDVFLSLLNQSGEVLLVSSYLGGADWDHGYGISLYNNTTQYITGYTWSNNFTTVNPYQSTFGGFIDAFVAKYSIVVLDVEEFDFDNLPLDYNMSQNYPNPFNPTTTIEFHLPTKSNVTINIYNLLGQQIQQLVNQEYSSGNYKATWDGTTSKGVQASTGIYLYRIKTDNFIETKKMLLLK